MIDATDATFAEVAIERSKTVPVVVDLWAEWCGPCKTLGPILERVVAETEGLVELVKVDVDANPQVANAFRAQSIPAVHALVDGKVVDAFIGALPESEVRTFVESLLPQRSEADELLDKGDLVSLFAARELEPGREDIAVALATELVEQHRADEALSVLAAFPEVGDVGHLAAKARLVAGGVDLGEGTDERLEDLLERAGDDDVARQELIDLLDALGPQDERTARFRRALASKLF
ncbi:MAG TPA: tetratricopeptide repeat protein [Acidimicrobiales bacterium]|nr:tetratricopeptide repeat protein [Acidimicrobiales bacterium]